MLLNFLVPAVVAFTSSAIGAVILLTPRRNLGMRFSSATTGFCAGVMLGAAIFSLILPGVEEFSGYSSSMRIVLSVVALFLGLALMEALHQMTPHEHDFKGREGPAGENFRRTVLIVAAIGLHNLPEGIALGTGYVQTDRHAAYSLLVSIALQNLPEGMIVAISLMGLGASRLTAIWAVLIAALIETVGAVIGVAAGQFANSLLPHALLACGGAMIYVVSQEMIPESHRNGHERLATFCLFSGFVLVLALTIA